MTSPTSEISFFTEEISFVLPFSESTVGTWLEAIADSHDAEIDTLNYIFCSDAYLHQINVSYLDHDTFTDIITFDQSEEEQSAIEGDIFISVERIEENASNFGVSTEKELLRVMAHGLLHLIGFGDKSPAEAERMREEENTAISLFSSGKG